MMTNSSRLSRKKLDLAARLATGDGIAADLARAARLYRKAMIAGSSEGAFNLATMYARGEGVPVSWQSSVRLLKRAERMGSGDASVLLADLLYKGAPLLKKNVIAAICHAHVALLQGDVRGQRMLQTMFSENSAIDSRKLALALRRMLRARLR